MSETDRLATDPLADIQAALERMKAEQTVARIWNKDASVWSADPKQAKVIANSLGWLEVPEQLLQRIAELQDFAEEIRAAGFTHAVVLGAGGLTLCPDVLRQSFGTRPEYPELLVLDSTLPAAVARLEARVKLERTLFIVASKSGSATEAQRYFFERMRQAKGDRAGEHFAAITDPGTILEGQAREGGYRRTFLSRPDIGERYSALSLFGMVPFAAMGGNVAELLQRAAAAARACRNEDAAANPGAVLGALLGTLANRDVNQLTLVAYGEIASVGLWIEQLTAGNTGKQSIVPIAGETLGEPAEYGKDRLFVSLSVDPGDPEIARKLEALDNAGFPVVNQQLSGALDLGATFFVWEFAAAVACSLLSLAPFE